MVGDGLVHDRGEERFVTAAKGEDAEALRVKLVTRRAQRVSEEVIAEVAPRLFPKWVTAPDGRSGLVASEAQERALLASLPAPIAYVPSAEAKEALAENCAKGESESDVINRAVIAWANWRKSAMKPG